MLRVEFDLYSGRENPSFILDEDYGGWLWNESQDRQDDAQPSQLGFRGVSLSPLTDISEAFGQRSLYISADHFALQRNLQILSGIIERIPSDDPEFDTDLIAYLRSRLDIPAPQAISSLLPNTAKQQQVEPLASCTVELGAFNPEFWNDSSLITKNNCYNYATNRRTNTFAQPGRATGRYPYQFACDYVRDAAISDGAKYGASPSNFQVCQPDSEYPRWFMALVVWPNRDYHWYRRHKEGYWGHKPGQTAAKNTDQSNRVISNPETCDRGPYTSFCGWYISGKNSRVS